MSTALELLHDYPHVIGQLTLLTGTNGVYDVVVDGEMLYSKYATGRHAESGEVLDSFRHRHAADVLVR